MTTQSFVNLPVKNLDRSVAFFTGLGFKFNPQFTDKNATCMIINDGSFVMLLVEEFFKTFTHRHVCDTAKSTEVLMGLSSESRTAVDEMVAKAVAAGATTPNKPQDHGFMYGHGFHDLDGHQWDIFHLDMSAMPKL